VHQILHRCQAAHLALAAWLVAAAGRTVAGRLVQAATRAPRAVHLGARPMAAVWVRAGARPTGGTTGSGGNAGFGGSSGYGGSTGSGGSTSNSGSDGSTRAGGDAGVVDGTAADGTTSSGEQLIPCGTVTCHTADPAQAVCCMNYPAATATIPHYSCVAAASACRGTTGGWTVSMTCAGSANCKDPAKPVCCAFIDANGNYSDECHSDCNGGVELRGCLSTSDCPAGWLCAQSQCVVT
jgi:hypothetical protein